LKKILFYFKELMHPYLPDI